MLIISYISRAILPIFNKLGGIIRELGWWNGLIYLSSRILASISPDVRLVKYYLISQPVKCDKKMISPSKTRIEVHRIGEETYQTKWFPPPTETIANRFKQNAVCLVAFEENKAVGCIWLCLGPYDEDDVRCRYVPQPSGLSAWDFGVYIDPQYRLSRTFSCLWDAANAFLADNHIQWSMSVINALNTSSIRAHNRIGAAKIGSATFFCVSKWQLMFSNLKPFIHCSGGDDCFPTLIIKQPAHAGIYQCPANQ